jgi:hypothetical protein
MAFPTTELHVASAEHELGVQFPREYRERLMASNGGELSTAGDDWIVFPVLDLTSRKTAGRSASHIVAENRSAQESAGFPAHAVAIAANGEGDYLVLLRGQSGALESQVHVWNHETRTCKPAALRYE